MTSIAWSILLSALLAVDAWYMHVRPEGTKYYEGAPVMTGLIIFSFVVLLIVTIVEMRR